MKRILLPHRPHRTRRAEKKTIWTYQGKKKLWNDKIKPEKYFVKRIIIYLAKFNFHLHLGDIYENVLNVNVHSGCGTAAKAKTSCQMPKLLALEIGKQKEGKEKRNIFPLNRRWSTCWFYFWGDFQLSCWKTIVFLTLVLTSKNTWTRKHPIVLCYSSSDRKKVVWLKMA